MRLVFVCLLVAFVTAEPAQAQKPDLALGTGVSNVLTAGDAAEFTAEYRFVGDPITYRRSHLGRLRPALGLIFNSNFARYLYGSLRLDYQIPGSRFLVIPHTGVGVFTAGHGESLGGELEFRSGIEVGYELTAGRLSVSFFHLSNAGLYGENPGTESLQLIFSRPISDWRVPGWP